MEQEKISFVYPSLIDEGMSAEGMYPPTLSMKISNLERKNMIGVTAGFNIRTVGIYVIEVEIKHSDDTSKAESSFYGLIETKYLEKIDNSNQLAIYTMLSDNTDLSRNGFYTVSVRFFKSSSGEKVGDSLDEKTCFFYVSHEDGLK
ncbi:hypothetical protein [Phytobacter diazotrophicus]|uniref:hypothetical protein n=1 Tax=Phytobacter diazotrophicus TaxID=395631 RepID=UPI003075FA3C